MPENVKLYKKTSRGFSTYEVKRTTGNVTIRYDETPASTRDTATVLIRDFPKISEAINYYNGKVKAAEKKGYRPTMQGALDWVDDRCFLCKSVRPAGLKDWWNKRVLPVTSYIIGTPKLNGLRGILSQDAVWSRSGENYSHLNPDDFHGGFNLPQRIDGELYAKGYTLEQINSMVRGEADRKDLRLYAFDLMVEELPYVSRLLELHKYKTPRIVPVSAQLLASYKEVREYFDHVVYELKEEGVVYRFPQAKYEFGNRTLMATKVKPPINGWFKVIAFKRDSRGCIIFRCTSNGRQFDVVPAWTVDKRQTWEGKIAYAYNVLCEFYEWTNQGKPRHATGVALQSGTVPLMEQGSMTPCYSHEELEDVIKYSI